MTDLEQILITMFKALESNDLNTYVLLRTEAIELIKELESSDSDKPDNVVVIH